MNIHPLIVHFPIAFLSLYAVLECVRFRKVMDWAPFVYIKATLLFAGVLGAIFAVLAGEQAENMYGETALTEMHSALGVASMWIFIVIAAVYKNVIASGWVERLPEGFFKRMGQRKVRVSKWIYINIIWFIALVGLICVMITGALGGALVYGTGVDPFTDFIYKIFIH